MNNKTLNIIRHYGRSKHNHSLTTFKVNYADKHTKYRNNWCVDKSYKCEPKKARQIINKMKETMNYSHGTLSGGHNEVVAILKQEGLL